MLVVQNIHSINIKSLESVNTLGMVKSLVHKQPIDPFDSRSANSYQVKIIDPGKKCYIALGVCSNQLF